MGNKVRFGGQSDEILRATSAERAATDAASDLTMMRRRVRTFYLAVDEIVFPEEAPTWANDWVEWLETGKVRPVEDETEAVLVEDTTEETAVGEMPDLADADDAAAQAALADETPTA